MAQFVERCKGRFQSVLDVGTGTGILGMACACFGASQILGLDNDIDARVAAIENIKNNKLTEQMRIEEKDLYEVAGQFDLVIANITHDVLTALSHSLQGRTKSGGHLILSGILIEKQSESIRETFENLGMNLVQTKSKEEWCSLVFNN